jgi:hypothetical protein
MVRAVWECFSDDYAAAARRFEQAAARARERGLEVDMGSLPLSVRGPSDEALAIHAAWVGPRAAPRVVIHSSGLHGPEAFAGSAIQLSLLERLAERSLRLPGDTAIAFVHVVNPYGMAWRRLMNENNVDLNRNFLPEGQEYKGAHPLYAELDPFMNPRTPDPGSDLLFKAGMIKRVISLGKPQVVQAFAGGQFEFPKGIKYGGRQLEEGPRLLLGWLSQRLGSTEAAFIIDVHTGLGPYGVDLLLVPEQTTTPRYDSLKRNFGRRVQSLDAGAGAYKAHGSLIEGISSRWPKIRWTTIGQEFGTYSALTGMARLRTENAFTHWGNASGPESVRHESREALLDYLRPEAKLWKWRVVQRGEQLLEQAVEWLQRDAGTVGIGAGASRARATA